MDGDRFDLMARVVGATPSRRRALGMVPAVLLGLRSGELVLAACRDGGLRCTKRSQCCSKKCSGRGRCLPVSCVPSEKPCNGKCIAKSVCCNGGCPVSAQRCLLNQCCLDEGQRCDPTSPDGVRCCSLNEATVTCAPRLNQIGATCCRPTGSFCTTELENNCCSANCQKTSESGEGSCK